MKPRRKAGLECRYRASRGLFARDSDTSKPPASSLSSLFPLSFQIFHSPIDGGDQFMVPLGLGPGQVRELLDIFGWALSFDGCASRPTEASYSSSSSFLTAAICRRSN